MTARGDDATARQDGAREGATTGQDPHAPRPGYIFHRQCHECGRVFDLLDEDDANEWDYGHDCERTTRDALTNPDKLKRGIHILRHTWPVGEDEETALERQRPRAEELERILADLANEWDYGHDCEVQS